MKQEHTGRRHRRLALCAVGAATLLGFGLATPASAMEADANVTQTANGTVSVTCMTPNPVGVEATPTISSGGVTIAPTSTPPISVPAVTVGPVAVGPQTVGPYQVGGFTVPPVTVGGTYGSDDQPDEVAAAGATNCAAINVSDPQLNVALSGTIRLVILLQEVNPTTRAAGFVTWSEVDSPLVLSDLPALCRGAPTCQCQICQSVVPVTVPLASGSVLSTQTAIPGANQIDPHTGNLSLGLAQVYVGVPLSVDAVAQPTGVACVANDFSCSSSAVFPVY